MTTGTRRWRRVTMGLPPTVIALGAVSLLTDLSSEMIYPLLPLFLVTVLGAGPVALGVIEGVAESTAALLKVASGYLTDRSGRRKPFVLGGYSISGLARPLIGLATAWPFVLVLRFTDRLGKGIRTSPRDALIADVTPPGRRGAAFGLHRSMDHAGAVLGPLVAAGLLLIPGISLRTVFVAAAIPALAVVVILVTAVKDAPAPARDEAGGEAAGARRFGAGFKMLLAGISIFALGNSTDAFLLLRFTDAGLGAGWVAVLWSAHHVVKMVSNWYGGSLSDRAGHKRLIIAGWSLYALVYAGFAGTTRTWQLIALFLVYGMYYGLTEPVERAWVASLAPAGSRGAAFGLYNGAIGIAALPASLLFGALYQGIGPAAAFLTGAGLAGVASLVVAFVPDRRASQSV